MPFPWFPTGIATTLTFISPEGVQAPVQENSFTSLEDCVLWRCSRTWQLSHDGLWEDGSLAPPEHNRPQTKHCPASLQGKQQKKKKKKKSSTIQLTGVIVSSEETWRAGIVWTLWQQLFDSPRCVWTNLELIWGLTLSFSISTLSRYILLLRVFWTHVVLTQPCMID